MMGVGAGRDSGEEEASEEEEEEEGRGLEAGFN